MSKIGSSASWTADLERFVYADVVKESNGMELAFCLRYRGGAWIRGKKRSG